MFSAPDADEMRGYVEGVREVASAGDAVEAVSEDDLPPLRHSETVRPFVVERYLVDAQAHGGGELARDVVKHGSP